MAQLTVIAKLKAKAGAEEELYEACRQLIATTRWELFLGEKVDA